MNELALYNRISDPIAAVEHVGSWMAKSGMFGCTRTEQGMVLALTCMTENISPLKFKQTYHLHDDGSVSMRADAMLAKLRGVGGSYKVLSHTPDKAAIEIARDGDKQVFSLTWEEAQAEPFVWTKERKHKKNWATPRARMQMLWARVVSDGVRVMAPEVVAGIVTPEEADDESSPEPRSINLAPQATATPAAATVEVQAQVSTVPAESAPPATAASVPGNPEHTVSETAPTPATQSNGQLDDATQAALLKLLDGKLLQATKWLRAKKWLGPEQGMETMRPDRAAKILKRPEEFLAAIEKEAGK
jgi:hypothetical protein